MIVDINIIYLSNQFNYEVIIMNLLKFKHQTLSENDLTPYYLESFNERIDKKNTDPNYFYGKEDYHIHTIASPDGGQSIKDIYDRSMQLGLDKGAIAITDHNTVAAIEYLANETNTSNKEAIIKYDGLNIITGCEVNASMQLMNGVYMPMHVCIYGFDRNPKNDIMQIISNKNYAYNNSMSSFIEYLSAKNPMYKTNLYDFRCFMREYPDRIKFSGLLDAKTTIDFYKTKGIDENQIKEDLKGYDPRNYKDSYYIDVRTLMKAVHKAGGYCVLPHYIQTCEKFINKQNLNITVSDFAMMTAEKLFQTGMDGFEVVNYKNRNLLDAQIYNKFIANHESMNLIGDYESPVISCGRDVHYLLSSLQRDLALYDIRTKDYIEQTNLLDHIKESERTRRLQIDNNRTKKYKMLDKTPQSTFIDLTPYMQQQNDKPNYPVVQKSHKRVSYPTK